MLATLGEVLPLAAASFGDKTALTIEGRNFSFDALDKLSNRLANALKGLGVEPGERVTLYSPNCWEWIVSYYGALKAGATINPINVMLTPGEVKFVTSDCDAKVLLSPVDKGEPLLAMQDDTPLRDIVLFGDNVPAGAHAFDTLLEQASDSYQPMEVDPVSVSTIGYTSGTTGHPKGAMLSHRAVLLNSAMTANMHVRTAQDSAVTALPCAHVYGNVVMNGAFLTGMTMTLMPRFDPDEALSLIQNQHATMFEGVPTMFMFMLNAESAGDVDLASLTRCTVGGQTMPVATMEAVQDRFGCPLLELWGMTEIAGLGTTHPAYGINKLGSIGIAIPYTECRIADVADANLTPDPGDVGELMVRGQIVMQGYYGNEKATAETIEPDGWLHTGDLARMDADGYVFVVDRKKDMIITAGYNVYPAEIERVVAAHPSVALVAVGSRPDETKGEIAKAYIVLKSGAEPDEASILAHCREHLAAYKVPRAVQFVDDVPKTSTGKIMRRELGSLDP